MTAIELSYCHLQNTNLENDLYTKHNYILLQDQRSLNCEKVLPYTRPLNLTLDLKCKVY